MSFSTPGSLYEVPVHDHRYFDPFWMIRVTEEKIRHILDLFIFSSLFLALECVAMTYLSCTIQEIPFTAPAAAIPFLVTFGVYNLNRKTDEDEDSINSKARYQFTKRYEKGLFHGSLAAITLALGVSACSGLSPLFIALTPFILGLLYSIPWLPSGSPYRRLKEIPFAKNLIVCISWALPAAMLPVYLNGTAPGMKTLVVCLLFFSWGFLASTSPDIRDRVGDAVAGVRTIPVIFGEERTRKIMTGFNLSLGASIILFGHSFLTLPMSILLATTILYAQACIHLLGKPGLRDMVCDVLTDGQYIIFTGAVVILATLRVPL